MNIFIAILTSTVFAALINQIFETVRQTLSFKHENNEDDEREANATEQALRYLLQDRIMHIAKKYIREGEITVEVKTMLIRMHNLYHNELGGNGDLDEIMKLVKELPTVVNGG